MRRRLVYWLAILWRDNEDKINHLGRYYFGAAVALVLQLVFWTWTLVDTIP